MNIAEAFTKFNKQNIILISGFSGSGKTKLAKFLSEQFDIKMSKLSDFYYTDKTFDKSDNYFELHDGTKELDWDNIYKSVNWEILNDTVNNFKATGIILVGFGFPEHLIKFKPDFHIHIKINKQNLFQKRNTFLENHPDTYGTDKSEEQKKLIFNKITYNHYNKIIEDSKIDKRINVNDIDDIKMRDDAFSYLINVINNWLKNYNVDVVKNRKFTKNKPYNGFTNTNYNGKAKIYDEYFHNKNRRHYDFNNEGIDYPPEYKKKHGPNKRASDSDSDKPTDSDDSNAEFLFTSR